MNKRVWVYSLLDWNDREDLMEMWIGVERENNGEEYSRGWLKIENKMWAGKEDEGEGGIPVGLEA